MIEPIGAKHAYIYFVKAAREQCFQICHNHSVAVDVADSDDEAYGRAMRIAEAFYPHEHGWGYHFAVVKRISGIYNIGRHDLSKIEAVA